MQRTFLPTRDAALTRLHAFTPRMGRDYAAGRNTDHGPGHDGATAVLSPYLRRRMVTEQEAVAAALGAHKDGADKFVSEVFWRTYFKGHLETRPGLWAEYGERVRQGRDQLATSGGLRRVFADACEGRTGIEGFDDWAQEIVEHNWLHNHARMWFASIWVFTLRLPWALGAELFMRHLLDGDPASNTLSWRWVAGLHTRGKAYAARAENIRRYTNGRFDPQGLDEDPVALEGPEPPAPTPLPPVQAAPEGDVALLLHLEDLHPESLPLGRAQVVRVAGLVTHADGAAERVRQFDRAAMDDALARASAHFGCPAVPYADGWADGLPVVAPYAPVGPSADALPPCTQVRREWDSLVWPRSTKGYFQVKQAIPRVLGAAGLA